MLLLNRLVDNQYDQSWPAGQLTFGQLASWSENLCSADQEKLSWSGKVDQQFPEWETLGRPSGPGRGDPDRSQISRNQLFAGKTLFNLFVEYRTQNVDIETCLEQ